MRVRDGIVLDHLDRMTDSTGLIQHAIYNVPRRSSGYTTDDNARALRLCAGLWRQRPDEGMLARVANYLSFLEFAHVPARGFHNLMSYQRNWLDAKGSDDCQGQAVHAFSAVLGSTLPHDFRTLAKELIENVQPTLVELRSPRAQAYLILAWGHLCASGVTEAELLESVARTAAQRLVQCYHRAARPEWPWFESQLTYANAVLPHAMFVAARRWPREAFLAVGAESFQFLDQATTVDGLFCPVGNDGWYAHGGEKAAYDQQPVEAATMAEAARSALGLLDESDCRTVFRRAFGWFHGRNSLGQPLGDIYGGSCCDGLQPHGVNRNQGAESTLAYLGTAVHNAELGQAPFDREGVAAGEPSRAIEGSSKLDPQRIRQ